jgi:hypothetical protein
MNAKLDVTTLPVFPLTSDLFCDVRAAAEVGATFHDQYNGGAPFPHICLDNFLSPDILYSVLQDLSSMPAPEASHDRAQERLKSSYNPEELPEITRNLFRFFNSRPFLSFLSSLTGIKGLIPDPMFLGGGIHQVKNGGHLDIHADFNLHKPMKVQRRINVLIYLNEGWQPEYGGQFEIWDNDMKQCMSSFVPLFNRCVVFNTTSTSLHGNPNPVNHPHHIARRSIALYYYTATWDGTEREHTTQFKARRGTADKVDWMIKRRELINDVMPPISLRAYHKLMRVLRRKRV